MAQRNLGNSIPDNITVEISLDTTGFERAMANLIASTNPGQAA